MRIINLSKLKKPPDRGIILQALMESFQSLSSYMLKFKNIILDTPTDNAAINPINKGFKPNCLKLENLICKPRATIDSKIRYLDISFNIKTRFDQLSLKVVSIK